MVVRNVEGKLPYTGGKAITVNPNTKVISLNLRDENNLIIYDNGDDEIYVDLQLQDGIKPNYAFPVGITTGRVLVADGWDVTGTIIVAKTTSGDVIKLVYGDNGKLYIDNGTGTFKQIYLAPEVDALLATKQDVLIAGDNITIAADGKTISATDTTYNPGEGIEIGDVQDYSAMQGPAPTGYHVPSKDERVALCEILTSTFSLASTGATMETYLLMPFAGYRDSPSSNVGYQGTHGGYWSSTAYSTEGAYHLGFGSSSLGPRVGSNRAYAFSVRCFRDSPVVPDSSWTILYDGSAVTTGAGVFHNSSLGLISVSGDGTTWYTIMDKNLGATSTDTTSTDSYGYYYQRGNNYSFPNSGSVTTSSTQVDASGYGPTNPYSSDTFIIGSTDWSSVPNNNLWGGVTGVVTINNAITNTGVLSVNGNVGAVSVNDVKQSASAPSSPSEGSVWYDTTNDVLKVYDGTQWNEVGSGGGGGGSGGIQLHPNSPISLNYIWAGYETQFEALATKDDDTAYLVLEGGPDWEPGEDTIGYYPLNSVDTYYDQSGNSRDLSTSYGSVTYGTYHNVDCAYFNVGELKASFNAISFTELTTSVWYYQDATPNNDNATITWFNDSGGNGNIGPLIANGQPDSKYGLVAYATDSGGVSASSGFALTTGWHNIVQTYSSAGINTVYVDGVSVGTVNRVVNFSSIGSLQCSRDSDLDRSIKGCLSEVIFEKKCWTARQVENYYNQTQANYSIS